LRRLRINPKSANLEHGFSGGADVAEERMSWEQINELEAQVRAANEDYAWLSGQLKTYRLDERRVIEDLCSDNGSVVPTPDLPLLRSMLNRFGMALARRSRGQNHGETPTTRHIQAGEKEAMVAATVQRRGDPARKAVEEVLKQHGIAEEQTRQMVRDFLSQRELQEAIAARELYRTRAGLSSQQP
jgi:hypothetical protein